MKSLTVADYAEAIALHADYALDPATLPSDQERALVAHLLDELQPALRQLGVKERDRIDASTARTLLDAVVTTLLPNTLSDEGVYRLDRLLQSELSKRELFDANDLAEVSEVRVGDTRIVLWQGDITTLKLDAIVNAANRQLLGCFLPQHKCIDNAIHSRAGVRLRNDCQTIMSRQGHPETTGHAKVTRAYNLPANFVIHTVGPIVAAEVNDEHASLLASCYSSILNATAQIDAIRSLAFCSISTGVFGYPITRAAPVAVETVRNWLVDNPGRIDTVVFNVFGADDRRVYESIMEAFEWQR